MQKKKILTKLMLIAFMGEASLAIAEENIQIEKDRDLDSIIISAELLNKSAEKSAQSVEIFDQELLNNQAGLTTARDVLEATVNASIVEGTGTAATVRGVDGTGAGQNAIALYTGGRPRLKL